MQAEDLVKRHGGRTTGQVSGKTTFLICGKDSGTRKVATVGRMCPLMHYCLT